ncbi:efflux transporter outer membrane subunit [Nitrospirillum iridis]|uniref:NodT family efflux transporter outer membrane factor (OMF) lipoprotein n=1 Tax=Nitrospirillum iridis TaxID=765888 RepID=A0A7X0AVF5_9PROT|nr:efflux transporter outer membrane subunit [Nitrospirillum iridis]MBB6250852.1 NodT family efflux transporter outer membrane factor (OMF) lipoprotein [Nitrospirillum iridis]
MTSRHLVPGLGRARAYAVRLSRAVAPFVFLSPLLAAGCAVGPDYRPPQQPVPAEWANGSPATTGALALSRWWQRLDDPLLDTLVEKAVQGNLDVASAKAKIREARASYRQAGGALLPTLSGSGSYTRSKSASGTTSSLVGQSDVANQFQLGFDASWELDLFGANRRAVEAAGYGLAATEEDLRDTLLTLVGDVAAYYVEARGYQARLDLARRTAAAQRETADLTRVKFDTGALAATDAASAEGQAASTEAQIQALESSYAEAVHRLGILLGREPGALTQVLAGAGTIPKAPTALPAGIPADILSARPDVRAAERRLAQYTAKIGEAEAARYPSVSLTGSVTTTAAQAGNLAKGSAIGWSFGPTLNVPLFQGGQLEAAVDVAVAQRDQYAITLRSTVLTALEDVENALVALAKERARNERLAVSATAYRRAADLALALYKVGNTSFLEVLEAQRSQYSAEDSLVQSDAAIASDYIALNKALGGGWDGAIDADPPAATPSNIALASGSAMPTTPVSATAPATKTEGGR